MTALCRSDSEVASCLQRDTFQWSPPRNHPQRALGPSLAQAGGKTYTRFQDGKAGYFSFSALPLYFGLGDATQVDRIEVTWPDQTAQVIDQPIPANNMMAITEPAR